MTSDKKKPDHLSFKNSVKMDLCALPDISDGCVRAELAGMLLPASRLIINKNNQPELLLMHTDCQAVAKKIADDSRILFRTEPVVSKKESALLKNSWFYELSFDSDLNKILKDLRLIRQGSDGKLKVSAGIPPYFKTKQVYLKTFMRGMFLGCGAITDPEKAYRLELTGTDAAFMNDVIKELSLYGIHFKLMMRHHSPVIRTKESESITLFLNLIGAHKALFAFENIRAYREVCNDVNRQVNCDLANVKKTARAAERQLDLIYRIEGHEGLESLPEQLQQLALLRKKFPEMTIQELGGMLNPPVGKSTVFKRFEKLEKLHLKASAIGKNYAESKK